MLASFNGLYSYHYTFVKWRLKNEGEIVEDELEIAETFNKFFVDKINNLKDNIYRSYPKLAYGSIYSFGQ